MKKTLNFVLFGWLFYYFFQKPIQFLWTGFKEGWNDEFDKNPRSENVTYIRKFQNV